MKPLRLTLRLHNNQLRERREALGLSGPKLAERVGIAYNTYLRLEAMSHGPTNTHGEWTRTATKLAEFYRVTEDILFPPIVQKVKKPRAEMTLSEADAQALLPDYMRRAARGPEEALQTKDMEGLIHQAMGILTPAEKDVLTKRYGLDGEGERTLMEVGRERGTSGSAAQLTEGKAVRKVRRLFLRKGVKMEYLLPVSRET